MTTPDPDGLLEGPVTLNIGAEDFTRFLVENVGALPPEQREPARAALADPALEGVLLPRRGSEIRFHSTYPDNLESILADGLWTPYELESTTTATFDNVNPFVHYDFGYIANPFIGQPDDIIRLSNVYHLLSTHRGQAHKVVIDLPAAQQEDIDGSVTTGMPVAQRHSIVRQVDNFFYTIPPKYIMGYYDLSQREFVENPYYVSRQSE